MDARHRSWPPLPGAFKPRDPKYTVTPSRKEHMAVVKIAGSLPAASTERKAPSAL
jgi:hypothetical protein